MRQHTIRKSVSIEGVGLHSGKVTRVTVSPAPADAGVVFKVRSTGERIPARPESVVNSHYATTLGVNGTRIQTVEHLMAAAAGLGIDNVEIEVDGPEIPALDGSAKPFVALLAFAGRLQQSARRRPLTLPCPLRVGSGGRWIHIVPAETLRITYTLDNDHPAIGTQVLSWSPTERSFVEEFAPARTYGFAATSGSCGRTTQRGGSPDNAIVLGNSGALNGLRFRRVRALQDSDLLGDLALLGRPVGAHVIARNGGHALNPRSSAIQRAVGSSAGRRAATRRSRRRGGERRRAPRRHGSGPRSRHDLRPPAALLSRICHARSFATL
jgi:UDP-3-O-[3-hydroxymyristoyl] N-acetylglucosamine deacetylase